MWKSKTDKGGLKHTHMLQISQEINKFILAENTSGSPTGI